MTRDTDSSSSGAQGRGGAAYPSGTPPYGAARPFPSLHPQERTRPEDEAAEQQATAERQPPPDEPRTETTLTTRIRINIPGSRPIPPVVVRTTVDESASAGTPAGTPAEAAEPARPEPEPEPAAPAAEPEKPTSDWFAPRKPAPAVPPTAPPAAPPTAPPAAPPAATPYPTPGEQTGGSRIPFAGEGMSGTGETTASGLPFRRSGGDTAGGTGTPFNAFGDTGAAPAPGRVPFDDTAATPYLPPPVGGVPGEPDGVRGGHDTPSAGFPSPFAEQAPPFGAGSPFDTAAMPAVEEPASPYDTGATPTAGGPYDTGATPQVGGPYDTGASPQVGGPYDTGANSAIGGPFDTGAQPFGTESFPPGVPRPTPGERQPDVPFGGRLEAPAGPTAGPATGSVDIPPITPDPPREGGGLSGDTLVSGIPTVPSSPGPRGGFQPPPRRQTPPPFGAAGDGQRPPGARPAPAPRPEPEPAPGPAAEAPRPAAAKPAKKGRSKPVLAGVALVGVLAVVYGAGLVMNHSDVPKNTTVLGVDIGNQNRDAAARMLDDALGSRITAPLTLSIGGRKQTLKPSVAGLSIDTDATVQKVAHSDYNPVSVVGSLFGSSRTAQPVYVMDEDKLKSALQALAGKTQAGTEGMVRFENHQAVAVPGKPGHTFDVDAAVAQVEAAYRTRAETNANPVITLTVTSTKPKVTQAALDAAVNGFGKKAMSGPVVVSAGPGHEVIFNNTLPQVLTMTANPDGTLAPHIDLAKLKELYGIAFDTVKLDRGNGSKTAVTPQDVATALIQGLNASGAGRTVNLQDAL